MFFFITGVFKYYRGNRELIDKKHHLNNWYWAICGCCFPILGEIIVLVAEIQEEIKIKPLNNIMWALWIIFRLILTIWWRKSY